MKKINKLYTILLSGALLASFSSLNAQVTTPVVGYTSTTLPAGAGSIFAPAFVHSDSYAGVITAASSITDASVLTLSGTLSDTFDEGAVYPKYYLEILNDTNNSDSLDTQGLILDIISNTANTVTVAATSANFGIQGNENVAIRKHVTIADVFEGATGLLAFTDVVTIYNGVGGGSVQSFVPDGTGGWLLNDFVTPASDAVVYPGTGLVLNNIQEIVVLSTGTVKETPTQVSIYGGAVNLLSSMKPLASVDLESDGEIDNAFVAFTDVITQYSKGTLLPTNTVLPDGSGGLLLQDFVTPGDLVIDGTSEAVVVNTISDTVYKTSPLVIAQ